MVRRGHDRDNVDALFSQLAARLREAVDQYARARKGKAELQVIRLWERSPSFEQVGGEAATLLDGAGRSPSSWWSMGGVGLRRSIENAEQLRADVTTEAQKVLEQASGLRVDPPGGRAGAGRR
jgi:hypothetical protein